MIEASGRRRDEGELAPRALTGKLVAEAILTFKYVVYVDSMDGRRRRRRDCCTGKWADGRVVEVR